MLRRGLALLCIAAALVSCGKKPVAESSKAPTPVTQTNKTDNGDSGPKYECLMQNGIPVKVIVKKQDARAYESFDFTGSSQSLKYFRKYFVFDETQRGYQIGDATVKQSRLGWVSKEDVIRWDTSQAIYFINKKEVGKPVPVKVWVSKEDVGNPDKPHFEADLGFSATSEPFPVLKREGDLVQVAILWDADGALASINTGADNNQITGLLAGQDVKRATEGKVITQGKNEVERIESEAKRIDIVLVIDVTGSMGPSIAQVQERMINIVDSLAKLQGPESEIFVGVVAYRDYGDSFVPGDFLTIHLPLTKDFDAVRQFLRSLQAQGSELNRYWDEAVFDGLAQAADESMNWGGSHSFKFLCLVGDAGPHDGVDDDIKFLEQRGLTNSSPFWGMSLEDGLNRIHQMYSAKNIQLYTFSLGASEESHIAFQRLATKRDYALSLSDYVTFIQVLEYQLKQAKEKRDQAVGLVEQIAQQKKTVGQLGDDQIQLLKLVGVNDPQAIQQLAQERVQRGWLAPDEEDSSTLCVYVKRKELEDYQLQLMNDLSHTMQGGIDSDTLKKLLAPAVGPDMQWNTVDEIIKGSSQVFYGSNSVISLPTLSMADTALVGNMRKKNNRILILLATKGLFNSYEEGWVPLSQLPVSK